ncbi:MAG: type VI secretion system amidase immunity protein Tai4 [Azoarcus sp.]|nr:type VI secretion system amidase immunity protein Tai4 [Azoarcus sp.]
MPGRFDTMKCIDLFHSAELNELVNRHAPEGRGDPARR